MLNLFLFSFFDSRLRLMTYPTNLDYINPWKLWGLVQGSLIPKEKPSIKAKTSVPVAMAVSKLSGSLFIRLAGLSGAAAVTMGAYGSHGFYPRTDVPSELKDVYRTANYYHFLHTLALLAVPLTRRPLLVGTLLTTGMGIFCGTCYAYALTGNKSISQITPYGGTLLIIAWLSMIL